MREWSHVSRAEPVIYELLLHENVKYLLHQVKDMKELFAVRERALQPATAPQQQQQRRTSDASDSISAALAAAQSAASVASNRLSAAAISASMFASRFRSTEPSPDECESQQKRAQFLSDLVTRALACEEIDRFRCACRRSSSSAHTTLYVIVSTTTLTHCALRDRKSKFSALSNLMSQLACAEAQLTKRVRLRVRQRARCSHT